MRYFWLFFCLSQTAVLSSEIPQYLPHTEVQCIPSTVIEGCVNAITGSYSDTERDIVIPGLPEDLQLERSYHSLDWNVGILGDSWAFSHAQHARIHHAAGQYIFTVSEPKGNALTYVGGKVRQIKGNGKHYFIPLDSLNLRQGGNDKGLTNISNTEIGGETNLKNQIASYQHDTNQVHASLCNGGSRIYTPAKPIAHWEELPVDFYLTSEIRPSGYKVDYDYLPTQLKQKQISQIKLTDSTGQQRLGSLHFDYSDFNTSTNLHTLKIIANDGREVKYTFQSFPNINKRYLIEAIRPNAPTVTYSYITHPTWPIARINRKTAPEGRFQEIEYYHVGANQVGDTTVWLPAAVDHRHGRVSHLKAPVGQDATPILTHRFFYAPGETDVRDAYNHRTVYRFNSNDRLTAIERYNGTSTHRKYSTETLFWGQENSSQHCNLICRALHEADGSIKSCRFLTYDNHHNVTSETLYGNLSGTCTIAPVLNADGIPQDNGCESYTIRRTYSSDSLHNLTSETLPNGRVTAFEYLPGTKLITSKLVKDGSSILLREFHEYNSHGMLIKNTSDDGSSTSSTDLTDVTYRTITNIAPCMKTPCLGLPETVENHYLDLGTGLEQLIDKQINSYSVEGRLTQQDYYDANNSLRYTLRWEYDHMGNLTLEQNQLGQVIHRRYDANGNKIFEQGPCLDEYTEYTYDYSNRLIAEICHHSDGQTSKCSTTYDYLGNRTSFVDKFGCTTTYKYDDLGRLIATAQASLGLKTTEQYDISGNLIVSKDAQGGITRYRHNIRGQHILAEYPDKMNERFEYNLDGTIRRKIAVDGAITLYTYDVLNNLIGWQVTSASGEVLSTYSSPCKGHCSMSETGPDGITETYEYDGAKRLTAILKPDGWTRFEYDTLGRTYKTIDWIGPQKHHVRVLVYEYDLANRITEERIEDHDNNILSRRVIQYTPTGLEASVMTFTESGPATTQTFYNAQGSPCKIVDAEGNETIIIYKQISVRGQNVLEVTTIDPLGNQTIVTQDALGRPVSLIKQDNEGQETAETTQYFNAQGNLVKRIDAVKTANAPDRNVITQWQYDARGRLINICEAAGTSLSQPTLFSYNQYGQKESVTFANGVTIHYHYDSLGKISNYRSSDKTVADHFTYDANGNILSIYDEIHNATTTRIYDANNRIIEEELANGLKTSYQYDGIGRITTFRLPDHSGVRYRYDTTLLRSVFRIDNADNILYGHYYLLYDPAGLPTSIQMVKNAGCQTFSRDKFNRVRHIKSSLIEIEIPVNGYDAAGNLCAVQQADEMDSVTYRYSYNSLSQLVEEEDSLEHHHYAYDSLNNRITKDDADCEINDLNQLVKQADTTYEYDLRGMRTRQGKHHYTYDALGRLTELRVDHHRWTYTYDAFNRRMSKTKYQQRGKKWVKITQERYLYQGDIEVGTFDSSDKLLQFRMIGQNSDAKIGATVALELDGQLFAPIHDHAGNVIAILDANDGEISEIYRYNAFGEETGYIPSWLWGWKVTASIGCFTQRCLTEWILGSPLLNPWRFWDKRCDTESGLIHDNGRYYDPETARWLTPTQL